MFGSLFRQLLTRGGGIIAGKLKRRQPTFSVVMTTYNRADKLPRVIASVLNQTYQDFEFVILDDGSTDSTQEILSFWKARDSRIRLIKNEKNKGIPYSRNKLIQEAHGKFITTIDSDDMMYQNLLQEVADYLSQNPDADIIYGDHYLQYANKNTSSPVDQNLPIFLVNENVIQNSGVTYRREFVEKNHISYDETFSVAEDYDFWLQMIIKGAKVGYIPKILVYYERRNRTDFERIQMQYFRVETVKKLYRYLGLPDKESLPFCDVAVKLHEKNLPFISENEWKMQIPLFCVDPKEETPLEVQHRMWAGTIAINKDKTRIRRMGILDESGAILSYSPDKITVKWDKWGEETFIRQEDGVFEVQ